MKNEINDMQDMTLVEMDADKHVRSLLVIREDGTKIRISRPKEGSLICKEGILEQQETKKAPVWSFFVEIGSRLVAERSQAGWVNNVVVRTAKR